MCYTICINIQIGIMILCHDGISSQGSFGESFSKPLIMSACQQYTMTIFPYFDSFPSAAPAKTYRLLASRISKIGIST